MPPQLCAACAMASASPMNGSRSMRQIAGRICRGRANERNVDRKRRGRTDSRGHGSRRARQGRRYRMCALSPSAVAGVDKGAQPDMRDRPGRPAAISRQS